VIKDDALQSNPWRAPRVVPPESAPNVLLIITDDAGVAVPSTFGSVRLLDRALNGSFASEWRITPCTFARSATAHGRRLIRPAK